MEAQDAQQAEPVDETPTPGEVTPPAGSPPEKTAAPKPAAPVSKKAASLRQRVAREREIERLRQREIVMLRFPKAAAALLMLAGLIFLARVPILRGVALSESSLGSWAVYELAEMRDPGSFAYYVERLGQGKDTQIYNQLVYLGGGRASIAPDGQDPGPDDPAAIEEHVAILSAGLVGEREDRRRGALYALWTLEDRAWTRSDALLGKVAGLLDPPCNDAVARRYASMVLKASPAPKTTHKALLRAALKDDDRSVRKNAVEAVGNTAVRELGAALVPALQDEFPEVRRQASLSLVQLGHDVPLGTLIQIYDADNAANRAEVLEVIAQRDAPEVVEILLEGLRVNAAVTRMVAIAGLATRPGERPRLGLEDALKDPNPGVRLAAIEALGEREDGRDAVPGLVGALHKHEGWQEISLLHRTLTALTAAKIPAPTPLEESWEPTIVGWEAFLHAEGR